MKETEQLDDFSNQYTVLREKIEEVHVVKKISEIGCLKAHEERILENVEYNGN